MANTTDAVSLSVAHISEQRGRGFVFAPPTGRLYSAIFTNTDHVISVDPLSNAVSARRLVGLPALEPRFRKWTDFVYVPSVNKLYGVPHDGGIILVVGFHFNPAVLQPIELVDQFSSTVSELNTTLAVVRANLTVAERRLSEIEAGFSGPRHNLSTASSALDVLHPQIAATAAEAIDLQTDTRQATSALAIGVAGSCRQPLCGDGTVAKGGECTVAPGVCTTRTTSGGGGSPQSASVVIGVAAAGLVGVILVAYAYHRWRRARQPKTANEGGVQLRQPVTDMFINPLHATSFTLTAEFTTEISSFGASAAAAFEEPPALTALDSEMYITIQTHACSLSSHVVGPCHFSGCSLAPL